MASDNGPSGKRLIVCCDGTWQNSDGGNLEVLTNVTRLARSIEPVAHDGTPQIVYYQSGVGTSVGFINRFIGGAFGQGLSENVREAYGFLAHNYYPGDQVILVGFSRGAFTARSICGLINKVGILTRRGMDEFYQVFKAYADSENPSILDNLLETLRSRQDINFHRDSDYVTAIACFDTVGSLGIPDLGYFNGFKSFNKQFAFHDTKLNAGEVGFAFHALALDENRGPFLPTMWEYDPPNINGQGNTIDEAGNDRSKTTLRQCWFAGVHSNIGGGYKDQELADITLAWMMEMLHNVAGAVDFCKDYYTSIVKNSDDLQSASNEWADGKCENSVTPQFWIGSGRYRTPGMYTPKDKDSSYEECIHASVRIKIQRVSEGKGTPYDCKALKGWNAVQDESTKEWKWVKKDKDGKEFQLREEALGSLEKMIAGKTVITRFLGPNAWDLKDEEIARQEADHRKSHTPSSSVRKGKPTVNGKV